MAKPALAVDRREEYKEYHQEHKYASRLNQRERWHLIRLRVLTHYSNGGLACNNCGELDIDVLQLDHINGGGNRELKRLKMKGGLFYNWLIQNGFPEGYQVLCANCNIRKARLNKERTIGNGH